MTVANVNVTKVLMRRGNTAQNAAYTGVNGEVVVDLQAKTLRIHDGSTLGGFVITAGGVIGAYSNTNTAAYLNSQSITSANIGGSQTFANANAAVQTTAINSINANLGAFQTYANATFGTSSYANANVKAYLSQFDGNINPSANVTYSLGNITHQWRDLWVSNNTIYIGNTPIRVDGGTLLVNNAPITAGSTYGNANVATYLSRGNVTVGNITIQDEYDQQWRFSNGALIWPAGDGTPTGPYIEGSILMTVYPENDGEFRIQTYSTTAVGSRQWKFTSEGNLIVPDDATIHSDLDLRLYAETGNIALGNQNGTWMFDNDGRFTAPGDVYGQYFTLRGGNGPGAEIGSLGYGGNVVTVFGTEGFDVQTGDPEIGPKWQFGTDGNLTLPNNGYLNLFGGDIWQTPDQDLAIRVRDADNDDFELRLEVDDGANNVHSRLRQRRDDIQIGLGLTGTAKYYRFRDTGDLEIPGDIDGEYGGSTSLKIRGASATSFVTLKTVDNTDTLRSNVSVGLDNVTISTGTAAYNWTFDTTGNLLLPETGYLRVGTGIVAGFASSPAPVISGFSSISAENFRFQGNGVNILSAVASTYGNTQVSEYLANYDGILNFVSSPAIINTGEITAANVRSTNGYFYGNGLNILTGFASTSYVNTKISDLVDNAPALLDTLGEIAANLAVEANVTGSILNSITNTNANVAAANVNIASLQSNAASQQTSIDTLLSRVDQAVNMTSSPQFAGLTTTANVNMTANVRIHQDLVVDGNINFIGNVTQTNITTANAVFTGDTYGFGALYAGVLGYTPLPYTVIQATADYNDYSQINFQNLNLSANASTEWVATAGNGSDLTNYIDFGIAGGAWNGTQLNSVGTAAKANDGWIYVLGNTTAGTGGNLVLGTIQPGKRVNILTGGPGSANIYSYFNNTGLTTANVYAANYLYANGVSILTGIGGTYSNTNVAAYLAGNVSVGNLQIGNAFRLNGLDNSLTTINGSAIQFWQRVNFNSVSGIYSSGTINAQSGTASGSTGTGAVVVTGGMGVSGNIHIGSSNSNSVVAAGSIVAATYNFANGVNILSTVTAGSTYSNVNVEAYIGGNIGAYQTFANANAAAQATSINIINANLGAFQTYANNTFGGSSYGNAAVAAFLPTYTGNIGAGNVTVVSTVTAANIVTTGTYGNITGANVISANTFVFGANGVNILTAVAGGATDNELRANVGAYQTFANANAATQATSLNTINANLGNFQTYANATFGTSSYGNANVAAYLPTYTGIVAASRAQVTNSVDFMYGGFPYMGWQLDGSDTLKLRTNIASGDYTNDAILVNRQSLEVNVVAQLTVGNVVTTNGVYWANGAAYSSGADYGNTQVAAYLVANPQPGTYSNINVEAYIGGNIGSYQTFANANAAVQATSIDTINANLGAFQTYANATFGVSSYGNTQVAAYLTGNIVAGNINATQYNFANGVNILSTVGAGSYGNTEVAAYLMTWPNADINILDTTTANITTLRANNFSTANAVISGGFISALTNASIISSTVVTANITNGNITTLRATNFGTGNAVISGGYISTLTNAFITLSRITNFSTGNAFLTGGYINSFTNVYATTGSFTNLDTSNVLVTGGYISSIANATVTGNVTAANLIGYGSNTSIVAGAYTTTFLTNGMATVGGNVTTTGNVTASGIAPFYAPNRPAFRVYGTSGAQIVAPTTVTSTNGVAVDFNQGSYYDNTTGIFTAPVPGLYHAYATLRVGSNNGLNQATIVKNNSVTGANVIAFWETDTNIGSAMHFSMTGYASMVAGDTLRLRVLTGNINLDTNDSWGVTYIG